MLSHIYVTKFISERGWREREGCKIEIGNTKKYKKLKDGEVNVIQIDGKRMRRDGPRVHAADGGLGWGEE